MEYYWQRRDQILVPPSLKDTLDNTAYSDIEQRIEQTNGNNRRRLSRALRTSNKASWVNKALQNAKNRKKNMGTSSSSQRSGGGSGSANKNNKNDNARRDKSRYNDKREISELTAVYYAMIEGARLFDL